MTTQGSQTEVPEPPPAAEPGGSNTLRRLVAVLFSGALPAVLATVAAHYANEFMGSDPSVHRSPGMMVFIFTSMLCAHVYGGTSRDRLLVIAGLGLLTVWMLAAWFLGLVLIETGVFGGLGEIARLTVNSLFPFGFGLAAYIVLVLTARRLEIGSFCHGKTE